MDVTPSASTRPVHRSVWRPPNADAGNRAFLPTCRRPARSTGDSLLEGSGKRRAEWQFGLGIQHEILPRVSAEVTYNRRKYMNLTVTDQLGVGCDRFNGAQALQTCLDAQRNYTSGEYDFFTVVAPANPGLPGGGGYTVRGIANQKPTFPVGRPSAVTIMQELDYSWNGVDTNFTWRGPHGIRLNGGTSTGRAVRDQCGTELGAPNIKAADGNSPACNPYQRWDTNVRGTRLLHDSEGGCSRQHRVSMAARSRENCPLERAEGNGDLGAEQRLSRDAAVHGRAGGAGRVLYAAGDDRHGHELPGQPARSG